MVAGYHTPFSPRHDPVYSHAAPITPHNCMHAIPAVLHVLPHSEPQLGGAAATDDGVVRSAIAPSPTTIARTNSIRRFGILSSLVDVMSRRQSRQQNAVTHPPDHARNCILPT